MRCMACTTKLGAGRCTVNNLKVTNMPEYVGTLYKVNASPPARTVLIVADLLGIKLRDRELSPLSREQDSPALVKKNPMRTIPFFEEEDFCLADSHAIIIYLMEKYGRPEHSYLYPQDKRKRATINQRLFFDCGVLFPRLRAIMAPTYTGRLTELSKTMKRNIDDAYKTLEMYLEDTKYLAGDVITLADISILTTISTLNGLHPINEIRYPKLKSWFSNMSEQEFSKRINNSGAEEHIAGLKAFMQYNYENQKSKL